MRHLVRDVSRVLTLFLASRQLGVAEKFWREVSMFGGTSTLLPQKGAWIKHWFRYCPNGESSRRQVLNDGNYRGTRTRLCLRVYNTVSQDSFLSWELWAMKIDWKPYDYGPWKKGEIDKTWLKYTKWCMDTLMSQSQRFLILLQTVVHVVTVWRWLNVTATPIWDCTFSPAVLWAVGILYPRTLWVHLQSTASRDVWIFYDRRRWVSLWTPGPHNPIGCRLWWIDVLIWCLQLEQPHPVSYPVS